MNTLKKLSLATLFTLSTSAAFAAGGETNNTQCNGVGNANSPCGGSTDLGLGLTMSGEEQFIIEGETGDLPQGCAFFYLNDGVMRWDEDDHRWYTTDPAQVRVKVRDVSAVTVDTDRELQWALGTIDTVHTVDYSDSEMTGENEYKNPRMSISENEIEVTGLDGGNVINLDIDHTLEPTDSFVAESNTHYWMVNTVTCVQ